jgi:hypothetical protein
LYLYKLTEKTRSVLVQPSSARAFALRIVITYGNSELARFGVARNEEYRIFGTHYNSRGEGRQEFVLCVSGTQPFSGRQEAECGQEKGWQDTGFLGSEVQHLEKLDTRIDGKSKPDPQSNTLGRPYTSITIVIWHAYRHGPLPSLASSPRAAASAGRSEGPAHRGLDEPRGERCCFADASGRDRPPDAPGSVPAAASDMRPYPSFASFSFSTNNANLRQYAPRQPRICTRHSYGRGGIRTPETRFTRLAVFKTGRFWLCDAENRLLAPQLAPVPRKTRLRVGREDGRGGIRTPEAGLPACWFSRPVHSTALPPFRARQGERLVDPPAASGRAQAIIKRPGVAADSLILPSLASANTRASRRGAT